MFSYRGKRNRGARLLIEAQVAKVYVAILDPDHRVNGRGVAMLQNAGIPVQTGLCAAQAKAVNAGFIKRITENFPFLTVKMATTLDGKIAAEGGESQWISSSRSRLQTQWLRAQHDAVLVGIGTVLADDPRLTVRIKGLERKPVRVVVDSSLSIPRDSFIVQTAKQQEVWCLHTKRAPQNQRDFLHSAGVRLFEIKEDHNEKVSLPMAMHALAAEGITRVLCEGGGRLFASFLEHDNLIDQLVWVTAGRIAGAGGVPSCFHLGIKNISRLPNFTLLSQRAYGDDVYTIWGKDDNVYGISE